MVTEADVGETYNIGGHNEQKNIDVVKSICSLLDELAPDKPQGVDIMRTYQLCRQIVLVMIYVMRLMQVKSTRFRLGARGKF